VSFTECFFFILTKVKQQKTGTLLGLALNETGFKKTRGFLKPNPVGFFGVLGFFGQAGKNR